MSKTNDARPWLVFEVARVTIEMESAFLVGSGEGDGLHDAVFAADANGLPAIPGETLAGVMRHSLADGKDPATDERCRKVFGFQERNSGEASAVRVSWAQAHGCDDRPAPFRGAPLADPVLGIMSAGLPRDHVRIGPNGAVHERGKFDELVVPAGARFTFELVVDDRSPLGAAKLAALLERPDVRLGRATRRGLGRFRVVRLATACFDLRDEGDRERYLRLPVALEDGDGGALDRVTSNRPESGDRWAVGTIRLEANDTWLVGGTLRSGREKQRKGDGKQEWDRFPFTERHIVWKPGPADRDRGEVVKVEDAPFVVPASSVKGALRHRTAFHARRESKDWLCDDLARIEAAPEEVELFGEVRDGDSGRPGRVVLDDARVKAGASFAAFQHVCLDRFTQGPMDGLLFDELAVYGGKLEIGVVVRRDGLSREARRAFAAALDDLCSGRIALGAGRSHGRFTGVVTWNDEGAWMEMDS